MVKRSAMSCSLYLAGKLPKGVDRLTAPDWRATYIDAITRAGDFQFLSPDDPTLDESRPQVIFGHDCYLVRECDILVINAEGKLGAGTSQEMVIAKYFNKLVFTVLPRDSHHRRGNFLINDRVVADWIHPFISSMSDRIFDDLDDLCRYLATIHGSLEKIPFKGLSAIDDAIETYLLTHHDA